MSEANIYWDEYVRAGEERARSLNNRGPLRFDDDGQLSRDILDAYQEHGFYVLTNVLSSEEAEDLTQELDALMDNAPVVPDGMLDKKGRPSKYSPYYSLSDDDPPVVRLLSHTIMMSDAALRAYAHPQILRMVASINGPDFIPFHEAIQYKVANNGVPTHWHQDGRTHWTEDGAALEKPDGSGKTHGFNLSIACTNCTPANGLWVVPGSHRHWRLAGGGKFPSITDQIPEAVPVTMSPGDCMLVSRSSLHGSYANKTPERRMTLLLGYHKRDSAIGAETTNVHAFIRTGGPEWVKYDEERVLRRSRMIPLAIDARRQRYPDEEPYEYTGAYLGSGEWNEQSRAEISKEGDEYWRLDMTL